MFIFFGFHIAYSLLLTSKSNNQFLKI